MNKFRFGRFLSILFLFFAILSLSATVNAAVSQLGTATSVINSNTHTFTVPAGNNRILLVAVGDEDGDDILSVNFGSTAMTQQIEHTDDFSVNSVWLLTLGNGAESTQTITATTNSGSGIAFIGAIAFQGVYQLTPVSSPLSSDDQNPPLSSTLNVLSDSGNSVFDFSGTFSLSPPTVVQGSGQTIVHSADVDSLSYYRTSLKAGATIVPMSWSSSDANLAMIHVALNINAAPTAASASVRGRVLTASGRGITNVIVSMTAPDGSVRQVRTGSFGYYRFENVTAGNNYILQVAAKRFSFSEPTKIISVQNNITEVNFVANGTSLISPKNLNDEK